MNTQKNPNTKPAIKNRFNHRLREKKISNALAAARLRSEGWTEPQIMEKFNVCEATVRRWEDLVKTIIKD